MNEQQTTNVGREWAEAERRMDAAALDTLLDPGFVAVGPRGFVLNRQQWLDRYRSGDLKNEAFKWQEVSGRFRVSQVYVRKLDRWSIAHIQISGPLPDAPPGG